MSIPGAVNPLLLGGGDQEYKIERSLRFNSADSVYLSRVFSTPTDAKKQTYSFWVKRTGLGQIGGVQRAIINAYTGGSTATGIYFNSDSIQVIVTSGADNVQSTDVFRDVSAWYHFVVAVDTTQATPSNRVKIYVNGTEITSFSAASYPVLNSASQFANSSNSKIGTLYNAGGYWFDGMLAEFNFIDGQALDPTSFGEFDDNGIWQPKAYTGTYGTNGFHLPFSDNSNNTATTLGKDTSGNGNNWTPNNLSVTAGAGNDSLVDTPTNYGTDTGAGGEVRGNYCTLNPLITTSSTLSNGNSDYASTATYQSAFSTIGVRTGKWYFEGTVGTFAADAVIGVGYAPFTTSTYVGGSSTSWGYEGAIGRIYNNGGFSAFGSTYGAGDVIGVAFDADTGKLWFAKNGTWQASGNPATGTNPAVTLTTGIDYLFGVSAGNGGTWACNFGQRPFAYTAPSGFKALCTTNLPEPTIADGSTAMDVVLDTGANILTAAQGAIGGSADLLWIKDRANTNNHQLIDTVRGGTATLQSNTAAAETTYSAPSGSSVAWTWDAGSSTVTNTDGTITSSVRANPSAGFSVVTFNSGSAGQKTIGHGLNAAPHLIIIKSRTVNPSNWTTYHVSAPSLSSYLNLNTTSAFQTAADIWGTSAPTSTVFGFLSGTNQSASSDCVAYCFAPVAGYSAFGSYTGNGSADGPFVYTGFRPRWILTKPSSAADVWNVVDTARSPYNAAKENLWVNQNSAENSTTAGLDILSNGFKPRNQFNYNGSGVTYIYAAFAENPFKTARAR